MNKWTKKQVVGAVLGGLAITALVWFCSINIAGALQQIVEQIK